MSDIAAPAPAMTPTSARERIDVIDILRGLALFGILTANMRGFSAPAQVYFNVDALFKGQLDTIVQEWVYILFQGKFITLFSFLFGLGFAVQMDRARERGKSVSFYPRRLFVLLLFGLIHSWFIWWGDILVGYALTGFVLFFFRNAKQRTIATWAIVLFCVPLLRQIGFFIWNNFVHTPVPNAGGGGGHGDAELQQAIQHAIALYRDGAFWPRVQQRFWDWASFASHLHFTIATFTLPRFLAGLWAWRTGVFRNLEAFAPKLKRIWIWSFALGVFCDAVAGTIFHLMGNGRKFPPGVGLIASILNQFAAPIMSVFYGTSVLLACRSSVWKARLTPFGAVGRMALTNYILQSILCTYFFRWTKLYGVAGPAFDIIPTIILYSLQVAFSVWWLRNFHFGPLEWLWRALTYGVKPPMRKPVMNAGEPLAAEA
jgi:uncharacterized protein